MRAGPWPVGFSATTELFQYRQSWAISFTGSAPFLDDRLRHPVSTTTDPNKISVDRFVLEHILNISLPTNACPVWSCRTVITRS
jgi:hypothetical protein